MAITLSSKQRDKGVFALRDISKAMFGDPRRMEYDDLDELQTILAANGLQLAPLHAELAMPAPVPALPALGLPTAPALPALNAPVLNTNEIGWIETVVAMHKDYKANNRQGYVLNMDQLTRLLRYTCRVVGIPFKS